MKYVVRIDNAGQADNWFYSENSAEFAKKTVYVESATVYTDKGSALAKANELHEATNKQRDYWVAEIDESNKIVKDFIFD